MRADQAVSLRIHSGVPIVDVIGEWMPGVADAVAKLVGNLTDTGHYDIVLNVTGSFWKGISPLGPLALLGQSVRSHCGYIDVVGTRDQVNELIRSSVERVFRLSVCEETAIGRIKKMPILAAGEGCTARVADRL